MLRQFSNYRGVIFGFLVLFSNLISMPAYTGPDQYQLANLFNKASAKHKGKFESLMRMRGIGINEETATLDKVIDKLSQYKKTTLLFYDYEEEKLRIWAINNVGSIKLKEIAISKSTLENQIYGFRQSINSLNLQIDRAPKPRGVVVSQDKIYSKQTGLEEISQLLLPNELHDMIKGSENLLIVPSLGIGGIPFAMLKFLGNQGDQLIDTVSINLLPSLFDIDNLNYSVPINSKHKNALVVGNPSFIHDAEWILPQLPGAEWEAVHIAKLFNTHPLIGQHATKRNILKTIESSEIIYFATHGVASSEAPLDESFLALSGNNMTESRFTAREIQGLKINAKLVVLSACQTGLGKSEAGGIIGLARAFKIAGADEVVVSLWNVDDKITADLMLDFMRLYQRSNRTASYILKGSMIKMRQEYKNPRLWAPFVVISGKGTVVEP